MAEPVLVVEGISKTFGSRRAEPRTVVDGVSFTIHEGETYGLLGPNGAGKTTTISMVVGLLRRDAGSVTVAGRDLDADPMGVRRAVGLVPQELAIYPDLTARENLVFFGRLQGMAGDGLRRRVEDVLELTGLADRARDRAGTFSGGMKRRLNIGVGLLHSPRLLILDEPTVGVDPQSRNAILDAVAELGGTGIAVLYTTHYMEEAERLCDRVGIIDQGRLCAEGTRAELVSLVGEHGHVRLAIEGRIHDAAAVLRSHPAVSQVDVVDGALELTVADAASALPDVLARLAASGTRVSGVVVTEPDLESVFLHLTGRALRD